MAAWLDPLRTALDGSSRPVTFFFRDDDVGWADERLWPLLDLFGARGLPVDLAAIPAAVSRTAARALGARIEDDGVGVHQHGFAHVNHESSGRKCEFGVSRGPSVQHEDIDRGRALMSDLLGSAVDPIFTPPWNRCTAETGACLAELGFLALSREWRATPLRRPGLVELPVRIDWLAKRKGERLTKQELAASLADAVRRGDEVGVMLHHAVMDGEECAAVAELLDVIAAHPSAVTKPMRTLIERPGRSRAG